MSSNFKNPKKDSILELAKLMDATVRVKCLGGRELQGTLKGYDELVNLVLDDCDEFLRGALLVHQTLLD
jgi:U6 snRNA-associated Sm-like protein LSm7